MNLDPANDTLPYPCAIDIAQLITLQDVMSAHGLGPNGGLLYCMEYLEANFDWLKERLGELGKDAYVLFDLPGQVELSTNHASVRNIVDKLTKGGFRVRNFSCLFHENDKKTVLDAGQLAAVHLCDAHYVTDASKYISVLLLSLRAMLHLELPHINVLSKVDLIKQYGDLGGCPPLVVLAWPYSRPGRFQSRLLHGGPGPVVPRKFTVGVVTALCGAEYGHDLSDRGLWSGRV